MSSSEGLTAKAIFKGKILEYETIDCSIIGQGKVLFEGLQRNREVVLWEVFHTRGLNEVRNNLYINDLIEFASNKVAKILNITKDLDGNVYYYTDYIVEDRRALRGLKYEVAHE